MAEVIGLFDGISGRVGNVIFCKKKGKKTLSRNYEQKNNTIFYIRVGTSFALWFYL